MTNSKHVLQGQYAGCDCIGAGTLIYESEDYSWAVAQQGILNLMAINAPNGAYSSLIGTATSSLMPNTSTSTTSTMTSTTTQPSNSSALSSMGSLTTHPSNSSIMTASSRMSMVTQQSNSSILTAPSATTTTGSPTCWTVRSHTICQIPKATVSVDPDSPTSTLTPEPVKTSAPADPCAAQYINTKFCCTIA